MQLSSLCLGEDSPITELYQNFCSLAPKVVLGKKIVLEIFLVCVLCVTVCKSDVQRPSPGCHLDMQEYTFEYKYSQEGEIIIGGIFTVNAWVTRWKNNRDSFMRNMCSMISHINYRHFLSFIFAIDEINRNPDILPNITLGYHVYDSCGNVNKVIKDVLQILSGHKKNSPNYSCMDHGKIAGFIGDLSSITSLQMAQLLNLYGYTQVSYGARDPLISDRSLFPNFFRTVQDDQMQYVAIAKLLKKFSWNWVGIISSDDDYGEREMKRLSQELSDHGICVEFKTKPTYDNFIMSKVLQNSVSNIIIVCGSDTANLNLLLCKVVDIFVNKTFIFPSSWSFHTYLATPSEKGSPANCSLVFSPPERHIPSMESFFNNIDPFSRPHDALLEDIRISEFRCNSRNALKNMLLARIGNIHLHNCSGQERFHNSFIDTTSYQVYIAVSIMAQALHDMHLFLRQNNLKRHIYKNMLTHFVKSVHYRDPNKNEMCFNEKGELPSVLHILNWVCIQNDSDGAVYQNYVGKFDPSLPDDQQLLIKPKAVTWRNGKMPQGRCSDHCAPAYRKILRKGYHICCYDCILCPEGEISNISDSENCQRCPEYEWPNQKKNKCIPKIFEYMSYKNDTIALIFTVISVFFSATAIFIIGTFALYRNNPIVKANNRNLSFILLISLLMSLLCVFMFIGCPVDVTCILRQISFGIIFTATLSSVLAKTIMVCLAFKATRPGSFWRKLMGVKLPYCIMIGCSSVQVLMGAIWLSVSPPFQEFNMNSMPGKIIIQCNEGSVLAFYFMLGYMGFLATVSFVLAFMVRTLPDIFNEAKYITFSMLLFCSVWICAIPAYLSSHGKNMVIVEGFAILASSIGVLSCIFFPKCYNILKPNYNFKIHNFRPDDTNCYR